MNKTHLIIILSAEGNDSNSEINWFTGLVDNNYKQDKEYKVHAIGKLSRDSNKERIEAHKWKVKNIFQDINNFDVYSEINVMYIGDLDHNQHVDSMNYSCEVATEVLLELFSEFKITFSNGIICDPSKKFEEMLFHKFDQKTIASIRWLSDIKKKTFKRLFYEWADFCSVKYDDWDILINDLLKYFEGTRYTEIFEIFNTKVT